jgi:hypothetical protein
VNAPLAFQKKRAEGADRSTTHHAKTDQPAAFSFSLPASYQTDEGRAQCYAC